MMLQYIQILSCVYSGRDAGDVLLLRAFDCPKSRDLQVVSNSSLVVAGGSIED